jgi:nucleoporin POM152
LYEREYKSPDGNTKAAMFDLQAVTKYANIHMEAEKYGTYKYSVKGISDSVYDSSKVPNDAFTPIAVQQLVHPRPDAAFVNPGTVYRSCLKAEAEDSSIEPIELKLVGVCIYLKNEMLKPLTVISSHHLR